MTKKKTINKHRNLHFYNFGGMYSGPNGMDLQDMNFDFQSFDKNSGNPYMGSIINQGVSLNKNTSMPLDTTSGFNFQGMGNKLRTLNNILATYNTIKDSEHKGMSLNINRNNVKGNNPLMDSIGDSVDLTGQLIETISSATSRKRKPLGEAIGLYGDGGRLFLSGGDISQMGTTGMALIGNAFEQAKTVDTGNIEDAIRAYGNTVIDADSNDELMQSWGEYNPLQHISARDIRHNNYWQDFGNSLSASAQGFKAGSAAGPWGAAAGAITGGVSSLIGSLVGRRKARKKARRINQLSDTANTGRLDSLANATTNVDTQNDYGMLTNYAANGGLINTIENPRERYLKYLSNRRKYFRKVKRPISLDDPDKAVIRENGIEGIDYYWDDSDYEKNQKDNRKYIQSIYDRQKVLDDKRAETDSKGKIPFIKEKAVKLTNAGKDNNVVLSTNKLDSLAKYAQVTKVPIEHALGLAAQESTFGRGYLSKDSVDILPSKLISNWNYTTRNYLASENPYTGLLNTALKRYKDKFNKEPYSINELGERDYDNEFIKIVKEGEKYADKQAKHYDTDTPVLQHGLLKFKKGNYNPKEEDHTDKVISRGKRLMQSPEIKQWMKESKYTKNLKAMGGNLFAHGGDFTNGVTFIDNGGSHEENPFEGVPMGIAPDGQPNLVEEGEVKYNDYIYSKRLKANKEMLESVGLPTKYDGKSFADIAKSISKESEERPNDPISKRGLEDGMTKLAAIQEQIKAKESMQTQNENVFAYGGYPSINGKLWYSNKATNNEFNNPSIIVYNDDKSVNWDKTYDPNSEFSKLRNYWINHWNSKELQPYKESYLNTLKEHNPNVDLSNFNLDDFKRITSDKKYGYGHDIGGIHRLASVIPQQTSITKGIDNIPELAPIDRTPGKIKFHKYRNNSFNNMKFNPESLRYAPAIGSGIIALTDALGWTNKPDYRNAELIRNSTNSLPDITPEYLGDYMAYNPFDRDFYTNKLNAQSQATRRAIVNQSGGNRANAIAGILAADYNAQDKLGDLFRKAEEYNLAQRQKVADFNRATNQYNSDLAFRSAMSNRQKQELIMNARMEEAKMRQGIDDRINASRSANLTNFLNNLGAIGIDAANRKDRDMLISSGAFGILSKKPSGWSDKEWKRYKDAIKHNIDED